MKKREQKFRLIDAFAGAGGFTAGFMGTGRFEVVFANDWDRAAALTYQANFDPRSQHTFLGDINGYLDSQAGDMPAADVVIGGPPCQGFSLLNRSRKGDPRRNLWKPFLEIVRRSFAKMFVMENVIQLLSSYELGDLKEMAAGTSKPRSCAPRTSACLRNAIAR